MCVEPFFFKLLLFYEAMCTCQVPHKIFSNRQDEDLNLITNDMALILKGNYASQIGLFVCKTKAKALVDYYDRMREHSIEGHDRLLSEIKKVKNPFYHNLPSTANIGPYFESVFRDA